MREAVGEGTHVVAAVFEDQLSLAVWLFVFPLTTVHGA